MIAIPTSLRYALRSLGRNVRRTILSAVGLAFGVGVGLVALSWVGGIEPMSINSLAAGGLGHIRIAPTGWNTRRDDAARLVDADAVLERARALEGVEVATPRARVGGLLGLGTRASHVALTGVDAESEPRATRYVRTIQEGRYLEPGERGAIVLGRTVVDRLRAELGDELVVTVVDAHGEMQSAILEVVGIATTGSRAVDGMIAHVALADVEQLSGRPGAAEITILVRDVAMIDPTRDELASMVPEGDEVLTWLDLSPDFRAKMQGSAAFSNFAIGIVLLVVLLGVASAQLTSVLERRKEFAVLAALGMRGFQLARIVVIEGVLLGGVGALAALAWTSPILRGWARDGIDIVALAGSGSEEGIAFGGVLVDPMYYPTFGAWVITAALTLSLTATILASLYPAWFASRTDPGTALRVDR